MPETTYRPTNKINWGPETGRVEARNKSASTALYNALQELMERNPSKVTDAHVDVSPGFYTTIRIYYTK